MSVYADIVDIAHTQAETQNLQAQAKLHIADANAKTELVNTQIQSRIIARNFELQRQAMADPTAPGGATAGLTGAPGAPGMPGQDEFASNPEMAAIQTDIARATQDYQHHTQLAQAIRMGGGDLGQAEKFDDDARQARQDMMAGQLRLLEARKEVLRETGGLAGTANAENFGTVRSRLDKLQPGWDRGQDVDYSPLDGSVQWGPRTQKVLSTMADSAMTRAEQMTAQHQLATEVSTASRNKTLADEYASRAWKREQDVRAARDKIDATANKPPKVAAPLQPKPVTASEANANIPTMRDEFGLEPTAAKVASWDYLRERNRLVAAGTDAEEADKQALDFIRKRVQPGTEGVSAPWYKPWESDTPATKPAYKKGDAGAPTATPEMDALGKDLTRAGLDVRIDKSGAVTGNDGGPVKVTTVVQARKLPKGTHFLDPAGVEHIVP